MTLEREAPEPLVVRGEDLNDRLDALDVDADHYWSGDKVTLFCPGGLPTDYRPMGTAMWGDSTRWKVGTSREHCPRPDSKWWRPGNPKFWEQKQPDHTEQRTAWVHVDVLGRVSFYPDQASALDGDPRQRLPMERFGYRRMLVFPYGEGPYQTAVRGAFERWDSGPFRQALLGLDKALKPNWTFVCGLKGWDLETDAASIDTTPLGVRFGEAVKSLVTASGSMNILIDRKKHALDGARLLQLVLMTEKGCNARAQFWVAMDRPGGCDEPVGSLFYDVEVMLVSSSLRIDLDDAVRGTIAYASTGEVRLRMGR